MIPTVLRWGAVHNAFKGADKVAKTIKTGLQSNLNYFNIFVLQLRTGLGNPIVN